ncbi:MAG: HAMP domain-containing histidine kinase [Clostridiales bacterium]|nr:HAMP domain-containing histidine kinase [Clostridiales bacterium]
MSDRPDSGGKRSPDGNYEWHDKPTPFRIAQGIIFFVLAFVLALVAAYFITAQIYRWTGAPPLLLQNILTGVVGFLLLAAGLMAFRLVTRPYSREIENIHGAFTEALGQIAQGNFNVTLDTRLYAQQHDMAQAINDMAQNLGNLETMRQDFVSNVSHEIQSPLTSISGFAAFLQKDDLSDEQRRHYAEIIESESKRLSSLSENLLKLSTLDNNKLPLNDREFRLDKQLERTAIALEPQWSAKGQAIEADLQETTLNGDEDLLSQVWVNLLHNAIKFTPESGRIHISLAAENGAVIIRISDTGVGIGKEDLPHIFERFFKADKSRDRALGGNGLGLSLVKKIVELHGGRISVESEPGRGTVFEIRLSNLHPV